MHESSFEEPKMGVESAKQQGDTYLPILPLAKQRAVARYVSIPVKNLDPQILIEIKKAGDGAPKTLDEEKEENCIRDRIPGRPLRRNMRPLGRQLPLTTTETTQQVWSRR